MAMSATSLLTEEQYLNLPAFTGRQEFRDGELIELPPATYAHSELVKRIQRLLLAAIHESRIWVETGFQLRQARWVVPDVCVIWPDQARAGGYYQGAPMVAIEVASRGNKPDDLQEKITDYLPYGVGEVCVIYPKTRTMIVHRLNTTITVMPQEDYYCELAEVTFTPQYRTSVE